MTPEETQLVALNADTFQKPLWQLAEVLAQKVKREAPKLLAAPPYVSVDMHVLTRQAIYTYDLIFYLNADGRRETDPYWRSRYTMLSLPLIRNMIDCLYNITAILQNPRENGAWFRKSGFRKRLEALAQDKSRYGGQPKWDEWIEKNRDSVDFQIREIGMSQAEILTFPTWPTMGQYINKAQPGGTFNPHQNFLKTFAYGHWREYSAIAHGSFEGLMLVAMYLVEDSFMHEDREKVEAIFPQILAMHIGRVAGVLLSIITELQCYFRFDGADINARIHQMWDALMPVFEIKELYDNRYEQLMKDRAVYP